MNRIEERMNALKSKGEKAFITYVTAGLPSLKDTISIIKAQDEAGVDVIELGVPFSDPIADGPVIQAASLEAINNGTNIDKTLTASLFRICPTRKALSSGNSWICRELRSCCPLSLLSPEIASPCFWKMPAALPTASLPWA